MKLSGIRAHVVVFVCGAVLQGCADTQARHVDDGIGEIVAENNLDLLFATEYPVASREEAIAKSNLAFRDGDLDKALFYSVKALKFNPGDTAMLIRIAHLHVLKDNDRMAARAFNLVLAQDPANPEALQGLGLLYFEAGNAEKARHNLELAVAGDALLWRSWNMLGVLADDRREHALAAECYEKALQIQPASVSVLINQGYSRYLAGELDQAARDFYHVATSTGHPKAWRNLALIYAERGWYEDALETFLKVEDQATAYNRIGLIALDNRDLDVAYDYFSAAVRHSPVYFAEAEQNLAKIQQRRDRAIVNR